MRRVHLLIPVFLILIASILSLSFPIPSSSSFISLVHAQESGLEVYLDPDGTSPLRDIYWGVLYPSQSVMKTMYVKNLGTTEGSLSLATDNWSPTEAQTYLSLTWDYDGSKLDTNEIRETTLTLSVSPDIEDITDFSFDIHIATEFTEPTPPPAPTPTPFGVDEYIEGEDAHYINEFMVVAVDSEASGGKYVWGPDGSDPGDEGLLRYSVEIEEAGTYRVWLRTYWIHGAGNSFSVNFDVIPVDSDLVGNDATYNVWHWVSEDFELADGIHELIIRDREDGSKLDRIFITNNLSLTPTPTPTPKPALWEVELRRTEDLQFLETEANVEVLGNVKETPRYEACAGYGWVQYGDMEALYYESLWMDSTLSDRFIIKCTEEKMMELISYPWVHVIGNAISGTIYDGQIVP